MATAVSSSSLTSTVPQFHWPSNGTRRCRRRSSSVSLPASAAFTASRPSLRATRPQALYPVLYRRPSVINAGLRSAGINDSVLCSRGSSILNCHSNCFRGNPRGSFTRFKTGAFSHNSPFPVRTNRLFGITPSVRRGHVLRAKQGPEEPHVASQTWSETSLDKSSYLDDASGSEINVNDLLNFPLPSHPKLHRGQLENGLRYIILPNSNPSGRFEAHMEVHVGSIDEDENEQGIAHMIEHVTFLGSKKREKFLSTGSKSNAYTDFHHTVFHIHSLTHNKESGEDLLPSVLDALNEIAFHPEFLPSRIEKERKAILSELQMMNTIEYRIDCQLLQHLHSENKLSKRFPIGLEEQIKKWDPETVRKFHEKWYHPCNATLYIIGDISDIPNVVNQIQQTFSYNNNATSSSSSSSSPLDFLVNKFTNGFVKTEQARSVAVKIEKEVLKHEWSLPNSTLDVKPPQIFQHELIPTFSFNMFAKVPVNEVTTYRDLRDMLIKRIFLSALQFRINNRYMSSNPPFTSVELDHSDSGREKCTVTTLHVSAEPKNWQKAVKLAVHEARRLKEFGVTEGEMTRYMDAIIKDSEQFASMSNNIPSEDILNFIMENDSLNHTIMDQQQNHESLLAISDTITLQEVNSIGQTMLEFVSDFGQLNAPVPTAIVACVPRKIHKDGEEGDSDFKISEEEIIDAIKEGLEEPIFPEPELEVPKELITETQLEELKAERESSFVELVNGEEKNTVVKLFDKETGIVQRRLSNGISVNYKMTEFENNIGVMRLIVCGGRATEIRDSKGSVIVGVRALSESGSVGNFSREQIGLFCMNNAISCILDCTEECIFMEFRFSLRDNGMRAAFQLLHMLLEHNLWVDDAFQRASDFYLSCYRSIGKSLERSVAYKLMKAMLNGDERFLEPSIESLQNLSLDKVKRSVMNHFVGDNMELSIVGDFIEEEIESCILDYIGTIKARKLIEKDELVVEPLVFRPYPSDLHFQKINVKDTDERACAYLAGPAPNRWGFTYDGKDLFESIDSLYLEDPNNSSSVNIRKHPLFFGVTLGLLAEIINSRLFTTVRDSLGLTYDVSFQVSPFDSIKLGFYVVSVTSTPEKVERAVEACKAVLRNVKHNKISQRELDRAKRTLLMKHVQDSESNNVYWLSLMAHLQANSVPRKDVSCIRDLSSLYEGASIDDVYLAYEHLGVDESSLFACIGISGNNNNNDLQSDDDDSNLSGDGHHGMLPTGRGSSTMTRPTR